MQQSTIHLRDIKAELAVTVLGEFLRDYRFPPGHQAFTKCDKEILLRLISDWILADTDQDRAKFQDAIYNLLDDKE